MTRHISVGGIVLGTWCVLIALAVPTQAVVPAPNAPTPLLSNDGSPYWVGANYMPEWVQSEFGNMGWQTIMPYSERLSPLGCYNSSSPEVVDWQIKWAVEHGVNFFNYQWYRSESNVGQPVTGLASQRLGKSLENGMLHANYLNQFKFTITFENAYADANVSSREDLVNNVTPYWLDKYFKNSNYLVIDNKPVVYIYDPGQLAQHVGDYGSDYTHTHYALDQMRQKVIDDPTTNFTGLTVIAFSSSPNASNTQWLHDAGYDAQSGYMNRPSTLHNPSEDEAVSAQLGQINAYNALQSTLPYVSVATVGWDSRPISCLVDDIHDPVYGVEKWTLGGTKYQELLSGVKTRMDARPTGSLSSKMVLLDNWCETAEGHSIQPSQQYGFDHLNAVRNVFTTHQNTLNEDSPASQGFGPYDALYRSYFSPNADGIIYKDDFTRSPDQNIHRTHPTVESLPGFSPTWASLGDYWHTDSGQLVVGTGGVGRGNAFLGFSPAYGKRYTLSADINVDTSSSKWFGFGFTNSTDTYNGTSFTDVGAAWWKQYNGGLYSDLGPGAAGESGHGSAGSHGYKVVLDTTGAQWQVQWYLDGVLKRTETYATNPTISFVGMGGTALGTVDNFLLQMIAPTWYWNGPSTGSNWRDAHWSMSSTPGSLGWADCNPVRFDKSGAGPYTITVNKSGDSYPMISDIEFGDTGYTLTGGELTLAGFGGQCHINTNSNTATINSALVGESGLVKTGSGTLVLTGSNTYTGGTTINAGTLVADFTAAGAPTSNILPSGTGLTMAGGTLRAKFNSGSDSQTVAGTTIDRGASSVVTDTAGGTLNLDVITRNTGGTIDFSESSGSITTKTANCNPTGQQQTILGGYATYGGTTWAVSAAPGDGTPGDISGLSSFQSDFSLANKDVDAPGSATISSDLTINSLRFNAAGSHSVTISPNKTLTIATGGILDTSNSGAVAISGNNLTSGNGQDLIVHQNNFANTMTIGAIITGSIGLTKSGSGTLQLTGANTYSGGTTINAGTIQVNSAAALGNTAGAVTFAGNSTLTFSSGIGSVDLSSRGLNINDGVTATLDVTDAIFVGGTIAGSGGLTIAGGGDVYLDHANTFSGPVYVSNGWLDLRHSDALGATSGVTVASGADLTLEKPGAGITIAGKAVNLNGTGPAGYGAMRNYSGNNQWAGMVNLQSDSSINVNQDSLTISGSISGAHTLTKVGAGTLVLSGSNTNTGTTINAGTLQLSGGNNLLSTGSAVALTGGTLDFNGNNQTGTTLTVSTAGSTLANTASATTSTYSPTSAAINADFNVNAVGNLMLSGGFSGTAARTLTKTGAGTLTLSGNTDNAWLGLNVQAGTVELNKASTASVHAAAAITGINSGATVKYTGSDAYQVYGGGQITLTGGTLDLNGRLQGDTTLVNNTAGSTLANTAAGTASHYAPTSTTLNQNLTINTVGDLTLYNSISGAGRLTKTGNGLLTLGTTSSYQGGTTVSAGDLFFYSPSAVPTTGTITINSGAAVLAWGGYYTIAGGSGWLSSNRINTASAGALALTQDNSESISMGSYTNLSIGSYGDHTYSGTMTPANNTYQFGGGGGTLSVTNSLSGARNLKINGNVNLNGASNHTGTTTITAGNLRFNSSTNLANNSITIGAGGALVANGAYGGPQAWLGSSKIVTSSTGALAIGGNVTSGGTINMGSFSGLYLGSTGNNYIDSTIGITPYSTDHKYRLGGGGGILEVRSALNGTNYALTTNGNVTLTAANTYTGATTVGGGTLRLKGSGTINNTSGITLNSGGTLLQENTATALSRSITFSGGTLGGKGTYAYPTSGGTLTIGNGSHLSPGDPTINDGNGYGIDPFTISGSGDWGLGLDSSSVLDFDFGTTSGVCDLLQLSGGTSRTLMLDGTLNISGSSIAAGSYTIFSGATSITDHVLILPADGYLGHHWTYSTPYSNGLYSVVVTAAPEPGTLALLTIAGLALLGYAWTKRR